MPMQRYKPDQCTSSGSAPTQTGNELSCDPGDPHAIVYDVFAHHPFFRDGRVRHVLRQVMHQSESWKEEAPGKPSSLLFLLLVAGEERDAADPFETREAVIENNMSNLMGDVAVPPRIRHQRVKDNGVASAGKFERAGEERVVLDLLEFLKLRDVDECVCRDRP